MAAKTANTGSAQQQKQRSTTKQTTTSTLQTTIVRWEGLGCQAHNQLTRTQHKWCRQHDAASSSSNAGEDVDVFTACQTLVNLAVVEPSLLHTLTAVKNVAVLENAACKAGKAGETPPSCLPL
jgi:hypothetical protein